MVRCLICYNKFSEKISFKTLFSPYIVCNECQNKLQIITSGCPYCSHPTGYKCCNHTISNISLYHESQFLKDLLYQIKYLNLVEKIFIFESDILQICNTHFKEYTVVPVPLSSIMYNKRGFNQSFILATFTKLPISSCLERVDNSTQSKKSYAERILNPPIFKLKFLPKNTKLLIIDDIYTTGTTLQKIAELFPKKYTLKFITVQRTLLK